MALKIIADRNIPQVDKAFAHIGEVELVDGRSLQAAQLGEASILLVRSVTAVNRQLLEGSQVRFVGSATIGTDHVDLEYLRQAGIVFANAPGCNAVSAAEYVVAAVLHYSCRRGVKLDGLQVGVVGYGNVGSRVASRLATLGCKIRIYDPPRQQLHRDVDYSTWSDILSADIVTAHVPLTKTGDYPTYHMCDAEFFHGVKANTLFINTSRGAAVDEAALKAELAKGKVLNLILDVWEHEPDIDLALLQQTLIASPHIAGYSAEGKHRGLEMVYLAACRFLDLEPQWSLATALPPHSEIFEPDTALADEAMLQQLITQAYDIEQDDQDMRKLLALPAAQRAGWFDGLRKQYRVRREFAYYRVRLPAQRKAVAACLAALGFSVISERQMPTQELESSHG